MKKEQIKEIGNKIGTEIFVKIAAFTKDEWRVEFEAIKNIKIPQNIIDGMVVEGIFFAIYYIIQRSKGGFNQTEEKRFIKGLKECIIFCLSSMYFKSKYKKTDPQRHEAGVKKLFNSEFDMRMKMYSEYKGANITELFLTIIQSMFNGEESKIKFVENTLGKRFKIKLAMALAGPGASFADDVILDLKILKDYVLIITNSIFEINIKKIINEYDRYN